jgi:hypothetical protein
MKSSSVDHLFENSLKYTDIPKVSLAKARKEGLKYYWTDEPCKHGHVFFRRVDTHKCVMCQDRHHVTHQTKKVTKASESAVNGNLRRAIENKLLDLQLAKEEVW